eukprot:6492212-Amphidinium_carterae.3
MFAVECGEDAPVGPDNAEALMRWPCFDFEAAADAGVPMLENLGKWLQRGISLSTSYSGIGSAEIAAEMVQVGAASRGLFDADTMQGFDFVEAVDNKAAARAALLSRSGKGSGPRHVFGDINERVPMDFRQMLDGMGCDADAVEEKQRLFDDMKTLFKAAEETGKLFRKGRKRYCFRHRKECCLLDEPQHEDATCSKLRVHIAGATCKDYSRRNIHGQGVLGPSGRVLLTWLYERRHSQEDIVLLENVPSFTTSVVTDMMGATHDVAASLTLGPECLGWWCQRQRLFLCLVKKGLPFPVVLDAEQLQRVFCKRRADTGPRALMFFSADAGAVNAEKRRRIRKQMKMVKDEKQMKAAKDEKQMKTAKDEVTDDEARGVRMESQSNGATRASQKNKF